MRARWPHRIYTFWRRPCAASLVWLALANASTTAAPVSFTKDLAPILSDKCLACHKEGKAKGSYRVDNFEILFKAGDAEEPPITAGKPDASLFWQRLITVDEDERMPQKDDPLPKAQIELFQRWIQEGAKFDGSDPRAALNSYAAGPEKFTAPAKYAQPLPITAIAWLPDGNSLVTSGYHEVLLWDVPTKKLTRRIPGMPERVLALSLHPDGKTLAVAGGIPGKQGDGYVIDITSGKVLTTLPRVGDTILAATFSPDGTLLATGDAVNTVRVYRTQDWKLAWKAEAHADWVTTLAFSPDGKLLASGSRDRAARIYDAANGEPGLSYTGHTTAITTLAFDKDGKTAISGSSLGEIRRWGTLDDEKKYERTISDRRREVARVAVNGDLLYISYADGGLTAYDLKANKDAPSPKFEALPQRIYALALDPTRKFLTAAGARGQLRIWQLDNGQPTTTFTATPGW